MLASRHSYSLEGPLRVFYANFNLCALCWQNVKPNDWRLLSVTCSRCAH